MTCAACSPRRPSPRPPPKRQPTPWRAWGRRQASRWALEHERPPQPAPASQGSTPKAGQAALQKLPPVPCRPTRCHPPSPAQGPADGQFCGQPAERGPCRAAIPSWYYDAAAATCRPFLYGGCQVRCSAAGRAARQPQPLPLARASGGSQPPPPACPTPPVLLPAASAGQRQPVRRVLRVRGGRRPLLPGMTAGAARRRAAAEGSNPCTHTQYSRCAP